MTDAAFETWPDWVVDNIPALARYVSVAALDETGLAVPDRYTRADVATGEAIAREVYESIRDLGLTYTHQPWRREGFRGESVPKQRVRYPAWVKRDSGGTCLDLALLYASALMRAQIRPYIAIMYDDRFSPPGIHGEREGHAFVLADLRKPLTLQQDLQDPPGVVKLNGLPRIRPSTDWSGQLLAVDPMCATADFPPSATVTGERSVDFDQAKAVAAGYLDNEGIWLCDVAVAQAGEYPALGRPADSATPAIWTRLPEMPAAHQYPSRAVAYQKVMMAPGRIVIHGPRGFGKSTLACARAKSADGGYGWWLNAADRSALQSELAQAEIDQRNRGYQQPLEKLDRVPFSEAARRRLEVSDAPWVLVLDNANGDPRELENLLPRGIGDNQTIIVTTTSDDWLRLWPEPIATHVELGALRESDMDNIPGELRGHVGGSPLFYEAARTVVTSGAQVPAEPDSEAGLIWQLSQAYLKGEPSALDLAHLLAWAPPVALPVTAFADFANDGDPSGLGRLLEQAGLIRFLARPTEALLMHGLIAERIRHDERLIGLPGHPPLPAPVALLATDAGQRLMIDHGDDETFQRLEEPLGARRPASVPGRSWGLAVYGVARAGEIRGRSEPSSALFEKAIGYLDQTLDLSLLSECWNGRARYTKDHPPDDETARIAALGEALSWAQRAEDLARRAAMSAAPDSEQQLRDLIRAERAHAMRALITRTQSNDVAGTPERASDLGR